MAVLDAVQTQLSWRQTSNSASVPARQCRDRQSMSPPGPVLLNNGQTAPSLSAACNRPTVPAATGVSEGCTGWGVVVVLAAFVVHCIVDGISYSFAVFYVELLTEFSAYSHAKIVVAGVLLPATSLFVGPVVGGLTNKFGCRQVTISGSVLAAGAIVVSSFSTHINMLIATYGLIAGFGFGMMRLPAIVVVSFYFSRHRALATSVILCGSGVGELVFAPLSRYLIDKYSWRGANCILGAIVLHGAVCGCVFRPVSRGSERRPRTPPPPRHEISGGIIMQKIAAEKRRRRCDSTGSLDNMMITSDGRLLSPISAGGSRTVSDSISTEDSPLRTVSVYNQQLLGQHGLVDEPSSSTSTAELGRSAVRSRTVSDSASADTSLHTLSRHNSSADAIVSAENCEGSRTLSDGVTPVPDAEVDEERSIASSEVSNPSTVVWLQGNSSSAALNSSRIEPLESLRCSNVIEMNDLAQHRASSSVHGPPSMSMRPPSVLAPLSSHPDIFYTGSCMQVNSGGRSMSVTSDDRKWADGGSVCSMLRVMLDVTLLQRVTFVMLAVSVLLCYFGLLTAFTYIVDHAMMLGVSKTKAALLLSVLGISSGISRLLVGWVADSPSIDSVALYTLALLIAGASTCSLPSLRSYQLLVGYQIVYGICCAVFITLKSILIVDLLGLDKLTAAYGILCLLEGVGSLAGTPLIGGLYDMTRSYSLSFIVAGSLLMVAGLVSVPLRRIERWERWKRKRRRTTQQRPLANVVRNII